MKFIPSAILRDENLIYATRPHWIVFVPGILYLVIGFAIYLFGATYDPTDQIKFYGFRFYELLALAVAAFGVYYSLMNTMFYFTSEYGITDKRVLMKTGWIARNTIEIFLDKVEAINVDQSVLGRILGYGTLIIIGTGGTQDPYFNVPNPLQFRRLAQRQIDTEMHQYQKK